MGQEVVNYSEQWAREAEKYAAQEQLTGGSFLSTRGGLLKFGEEELPGNQACVIILDAVKENTFYGAEYDPENSSAPICYAFGRGDEDMGPHESMQNGPDYFSPQHEECNGCPMNEWGTADKGKGKACQNRRRLAVLPAGMFVPRKGSRDFDLDIYTDPKHYQAADIMFVKLPVMSVKDWAKYVTQINASIRRPPHGVITRLFLEPDPKSQYRVRFEMLEEVPDELAAIVMARHEEAMKMIVQGYRAPDPEEAGKAGKAAGGVAGLRRR